MNLLESSNEDLLEALKKSRLNVSVYGLGRVGLPLAAAWLRAGAKVLGVDVNKSWVEKLNSGRFEFRDEPSLQSILKSYISSGMFKAVTDGVYASKFSNIKLVAVPTSIDLDSGEPDLSALIDALKNIAGGLKRGDLVVLESSVPPGTTINLAKPLLESISRLKVEVDFGLAYSPERVMVGRALKDIEENYPKIVGGIGPKSTRIISTLYSLIARRGVIKLSSTTAAETAKLFEGIYRDVNIALANELSKLCLKMGLDFMEIREACNSQPYCNLHIPGIGVGGACIPIYPRYVMWIADQLDLNLPITSNARRINDEMPKYALNLLLKALKNLDKHFESVKIAVLGLAFRGNTSDTRLSPAYPLIYSLINQGFKVYVHDPWVEGDIKLNFKGAVFTSLEEALKGSDAAIIVTDHDEFKQLPERVFVELMNKPAVILDGRNIYRNRCFTDNILYISMGGKISGMKLALSK